ncbi:dipeptidase PepV [Metabacillus sp. RGM 3146]|uniref:dipeptidase PepV n=1 Tax=Metabacillus sp. RGM 3146 TaxID=3401092 RepID=UPI003B99EC95
MNDWQSEMEKRKEKLISDTQAFLQIKSVLDENAGKEGAPFGEGINEALHHLLNKGNEDGFTVKNLDGYAGHIEMGKGEEIVGILCHIDVVPEGDGWSSDPFGAEIRDGKIFARGALDDKGPTMAAYHAMKLVKDLGLDLNKRVRMIIGTDEESDWRCVEHYFKHEEMPAMGFAPDADFPIIYAEKGIVDAKLKTDFPHEEAPSDAVLLHSFDSGRRFNMVPDFAEAILSGSDKLKTGYDQYLSDNGLSGSVTEENGNLHFKLEGVSAHAMEPNNGKNAGIFLADYLLKEELDKHGSQFLTLVTDYFHADTRGKKLGIEMKDEISGELTVNAGIIRYSEETGGELGINIRYPVTAQSDFIREKLGKIPGVNLNSFSDSKPHHVDENDPLIQTLKKVYEEQTGEKAELISIGGGTYARSLEAGVAFGPLFPGRPDIAHQKDEYMEIDDLVKAAAIYAQAIYELAK